MTLYEQWQDAGGTVLAAEALLSASGLPLHPSRQVAEGLRGARRGPTRWHLGKLNDWMHRASTELQQAELAETAAVATDDAPPAPDQPTVALTAEQNDLLSAPPASEFVVLLRARAKALHKEQAHQHALLTQATDDEARATLARDIMERIVPALDVLYDRIRALQGGAPDPHPDPATAGTENLTRALQAARSRLSRLKQKIKGPKSADDLKTLNAQKSELEAEITRLLAAGA